MQQMKNEHTFRLLQKRQQAKSSKATSCNRNHLTAMKAYCAIPPTLSIQCSKQNQATLQFYHFHVMCFFCFSNLQDVQTKLNEACHILSTRKRRVNYTSTGRWYHWYACRIADSPPYKQTVGHSNH